MAKRVITSLLKQSLMQPAADPARQYLAKRGLSSEVITRFAIGYAKARNHLAA
jgi:DNA primase